MANYNIIIFIVVVSSLLMSSSYLYIFNGKGIAVEYYAVAKPGPIKIEQSADVILMKNFTDMSNMSMESKPLCTNDVFRKHYAENAYFPSKGNWDTTSDPPQYILDICEFRNIYYNYPRDLLSRCFQKPNVRYIVTMGDSNAKLHNGALFRLLKHAATVANCTCAAREDILDDGFIPDRAYFALEDKPWADFVKVKRRTCRTCYSRRYECDMQSDDTSHEVTLEHISQTQVIDEMVTIEGNDTHSKWIATTSQEFYFKYFLNGRYPDLLIVFLPFNHAARHSLDMNMDQIREFKRIIDKYLPMSTKVYFVPATSEFDEKYKKDSQRERIQGLHRNDRLEFLNRVLFGVMEDDFLDATSNRYGFVDVFTISKHLAAWSTDGIHMSSLWSRIEMSMLLELFCNSFTLDEM